MISDANNAIVKGKAMEIICFILGAVSSTAVILPIMLIRRRKKSARVECDYTEFLKY